MTDAIDRLLHFQDEKRLQYKQMASHAYPADTHQPSHYTVTAYKAACAVTTASAHPLVTCLGPSLNTLWITKQAFQHTTDTCLRGNLATTRHTVLALFSRQVAMTTSSLWSRKEVYRRHMHLTTKESMGPHILTRHRSLGEHMATCTASVQEHTEGPIYWPLPISWYTTCVLCGYHTETYGVSKVWKVPNTVQLPMYSERSTSCFVLVQHGTQRTEGERKKLST